MRLASLTILSLMASTSLTWAQSTAEDTFSQLMADYNNTGFLTAKVDSQTYDEASDTLNAQNLKITFSFKWDESNRWLAMFPPTPELSKDKASDKSDKKAKSDKDASFLALDVTYTAPSISYKGLKGEEGNGYSFEQFDIDNAKITLKFQSHESDTDQTTNVELQGTQSFKNGYIPFMGKFTADEAKPFTSFFTYFRPLLLDTRIEESTTPVQSATHATGKGKIFQRETHGPVTVKNVANGKIASIVQAYQKGETDLAAQLPDDLDKDDIGELPDKVNYEVGEIRYQDLDMGTIWSLLDPGMPSYDGRKTALVSSSTGAITAQGEKSFDLSIGATSQTNFQVSQPKSYLVSELEKALPNLKKDSKLDDATIDKLMDAYVALFGAIALERMEMGPIEAHDRTERDDPEAPQSVTIDRLLLSNLSSDGLDEFSLTNLLLKAKKLKQSSIERFAITNVEFPPYEAIKAITLDQEEGREPTAEEYARAAPNKVEVGLQGLAFEDMKGNKVTAKDIHLAVRTDGLAIPAHVSLKTDQLTLSRAMLSHPLAQTLLAQLNMNELTLNKNVELNWNGNDETYKLSPLVIDLLNIAKLDGEIGFGGIKRDYLANPDKAQQAMATASVLPAELRLQDQGGLGQLINLAGLMTGMSPDQLQMMAPMQIEAILGAYTTPKFAQHVASQVGTFLQDPKSLRIMLAPTSPIPVAQILGVIATAPQSLPDILKIDVAANQL